jgi:ribosomal protein L34
MDIKDLDALEKACNEMGLEFIPNQKTYKWWGHHVGDYPLPKGFSKADMGKCDHAVRIKGDSEAYEVGIVKRRDGRPGYTMLFDFFAGGKGLMKKIGDNADLLTQEYSVQVNIKKAKQKGFTVTRKTVNGEVILNARRLARR